MGEPELTWRVHPAAERSGMTLLVGLLILGVSLLVAAWMRAVYWGVFALGVLFLSLESYFLPTRFALGDDGVGVSKPFSRLERPWSAFRSAWFDPLGVTLSPFGRRHWLEPYRGVRLRYARAGAGPSREEVVAFLLSHLDAARVRIEGAGVAAAGPRAGDAGE
ncbi:MAG: hypothetical protein V1774_08730 [Candidatus Eisenbacteria bacterium]